MLIPEALRTKYADGDGGQPFVMLGLAPLRLLRENLDAESRLLTSVDVELFVADCFSERSWSGRLREALASDSETIGRTATLTGMFEPDLRALAERRGALPAPLIWAGDVQRAIATVRTAYGAGLVDAETAWRLIERAGSVAAAVYDGWDDYFAGLRVTYALAANTLEAVNDFDRSLTGLRASRWPAARTSFPTATPGFIAPAAVRGEWPDDVLPREDVE